MSVTLCNGDNPFTPIYLHSLDTLHHILPPLMVVWIP